MREFAARAPRNYLLSKNRCPLAASAQENIRRKKQILHRILRSGGLPYVSMPSPSRLGSAQNLRFSDANSFANIFHIKSLPHSVYGGDFFRFNPASKKSLAKPHFFLCGGSFWLLRFFVRRRKNLKAPPCSNRISPAEIRHLPKKPRQSCVFPV